MSENSKIITLMSFGFKYGPPEDANIVMDVRFLQNPFWVEELKEKTGLDREVGKYIQQDSGFESFLNDFKNLLQNIFPRYEEEAELTIAIGCTGGRHRSVFTVETLGSWMQETGLQTHIVHRDLKEQ